MDRLDERGIPCVVAQRVSELSHRVGQGVVRDELGGPDTVNDFLPAQDFTRLIKMGRIGQSGETYAFSKYGKMLSESRFDQQLRAVGLLGESQSSIMAPDKIWAIGLAIF